MARVAGMRPLFYLIMNLNGLAILFLNRLFLIGSGAQGCAPCSLTLHGFLIRQKEQEVYQPEGLAVD